MAKRIRPPHPLVALVLRFARRLRFPVLFFVTAGLFLLTLVLPDPLPFADELLLGLAAVLFASWRERRSGGAGDRAEGDEWGPRVEKEVRDVHAGRRPGGGPAPR